MPGGHGGRWRRLLPAVGYAVLTAVPVTGLACLVRERVTSVVELDTSVIASATDLTRDHPVLLNVLVTWQEAFQPRWVYLAGTGVCVWVWRRHRLTSRALWGFVTMMVAWNLALDLKYVVQRARPVVTDPVASAPGYSFPSGHAANTAAAATAVVILLWPVLTTRAARGTACAVAGVLVVLTGADRVLLGVHYPSDVVAGALMGAGLVLASYAGYRGWSPARPTDEGESPEEVDAAEALATSTNQPSKEY